MAVRTAWPTVSSSQLWTSANFNLYGRDNDLAYWPYIAVGDMVYGASASTLAKIGIGTAGGAMWSNGTNPAWRAKAILSGMVNFKSTIDFSPNQTFATTWQDVTGSAVTLTLNATSTVLVLATVTGYNQNTTHPYSFVYRIVVNGTGDPSATAYVNNAMSVNRNENLPLVYYATGISAGTTTVKLQSQIMADFNIVTQGRLIAIAFVE